MGYFPLVLATLMVSWPTSDSSSASAGASVPRMVPFAGLEGLLELLDRVSERLSGVVPEVPPSPG